MTQRTENVETPSSRRKFIKKASVGALITTLPAQSVWGACTVSGALSGGSKVNNDCISPSFLVGMSPGFWKDPSNGNRLASKFSYPTTDEKRAELLCDIELAKDVNVTFGTGAQQFTFNVRDALDKNLGAAFEQGFMFNLAAVYLNMVYGFQTLPIAVTLPSGDTITSENELLTHIYAADLQIRQDGGSGVSFTYDENVVSDYIPSSPTCSI